MNFIIKTARLAFFLTLLYLVCRGLMAGMRFLHSPGLQALSLSVSFVAQITYTLVIVWLILFLHRLKAKAVTIGLAIYLLLVNISFVISLLISNGLTSLIVLQFSSVTAITIFVAILFMIATSFSIVPSVIGVRLRIFLISIIIVTLLRSALLEAIVKWYPQQVAGGADYGSLLALLPAIGLLFVVQKAAVVVENNK